jgi:hypothetical protein
LLHCETIPDCEGELTVLIWKASPIHQLDLFGTNRKI